MKTENEIQSIIAEETAKPAPKRAKVAPVEGATSESGESTRVKSPLSVAIDTAADRAMSAAAAAAWCAGRREILRTAAALIEEGKITRTAARSAWKSTNGLRSHVSSAKENNGGLQPAGPSGRYWFDGENSDIVDAVKNLGNVARAYNVRYYEEGNAREKEAEIQAKLDAAAAAAKEAKRLQLIDEMNAAENAGDLARALAISKELLNF